MTGEHPFLRAINLAYDAEAPERIAHYEPTSKAVGLLEGIGGQQPQRAFFVIAPYGSGKSLSATYLLQLIENRREAAATLRLIAERLAPVSPALASFARERLDRPQERGVVLALEGAVSDIGIAFARAAAASLRRIGLSAKANAIAALETSGIEGAIAVLDLLYKTARTSQAKTQIERIAIVWDEFGRHVEQLVRAGEPHRLAEIQRLAEYAARCQAVPLTLGLIMHQGLLQYASGLSQAALAEWRKIEGRFEPIDYVDDSHELYRLIAKVVAANRPAPDLFGNDTERAEQARRLGLLGGLADELPALLATAWPLEPATLHVLPRLAARAAQHERTLFGFLLTVDLSAPVTLAHLYDYFAPAMQADTALGGTYRKWLETESALAKADTAAELQALKTAAILELGFSGERLRVTREVLTFALGGETTARPVIDALLERKLLLHRRRSDQVSLWHGTDVDLRARLDEAMARQGRELDVIAQLNADFRPPPFRPVRHNDRCAIRRYFATGYVGVEGFAAQLDAGERFLAPGEDGRILYLIPSDEQARQRALALAARCTTERLLVVVPAEASDLHTAAAEVHALERMRTDPALLAEDPLIDRELVHMLDEAQGHLHSQISRLTAPSAATHWFHAGEALGVRDVAGLLEALSGICDAAFPKTPRINNEMIVRHRLSRPLVNARKKVLLGILERHGEEKLGIAGEHADASVFRTVVQHTGLYRESESGVGYRYAAPSELEDPHLAEVWRRFETLITEPTEQPKDLAAVFNALIEPPYGMRHGVLPILFAASLRAFRSALAITDDKGAYLEDLLPSHIEAICAEPERYRLSVIELHDWARDYLEALTRIFAPTAKAGAKNSGDLVRQAYDAFEAWQKGLPPGARDSRTVGESGRRLQGLLRSSASPIELFFRRLPRQAESNALNSAVIAWAQAAKAELDGVIERYRNGALDSLDDALQFDAEAAGESVRARFGRWRGMLAGGTAERLGGLAKNLLNLNLDFYKDDRAFIDALGALIVGRQPKRWDDSDLRRFHNEVNSLVSRIEAAALAETDTYSGANTALIERRLKTYVERLAATLGPEATREHIQTILRDLEDDNGEPGRSASHG